MLGLAGCQWGPPPSRADLVHDAREHLEKGEYTQALGELASALKLDPNNAEVHLQLGWASLLTDDLDKTADELDWLEAQKTLPKGTMGLKGAFYEKLEEWPEAQVAYSQAVKEQPKDKDAHVGLGRVLLEQEEAKAALREFNLAQALDAKDSNIAFQRCVAYRQLREWQHAEAACAEAKSLTTDPEAEDNIESVLQTIHLLQDLKASDGT